MSNFDFNDAGPQKDGELIPDKTFAKVMLSLRPGGDQSSGGWLKQSGSSDAKMLDCEFTILEGLYERRKIWQYMVMEGGKTNDQGQSIAAEISRATLRAMLESSRNINPTDMSPTALEARRVNSYEDFDGMILAVKIGIEKSKDPQYPDKNKIAAVITPEQKIYAQIITGGGVATAQPPASKPAWGSNAPASSPAAQPAWAAAQPATPAPVAAGNGGKGAIPAWAQ